MLTWYGSLDGSIGKILPIGEKTYKKLQLLQTLMQTHMPHHAGLNPKEYRSATNAFRELVNPAKNIIDGDLITRFHYLSITEQIDMSRKIGIQREEILNDLMDTYRATNIF